jgi:hypothetical protein
MAVLLCVRTLLCGRPSKMGIAGGPIGRRRLAPTAPKVASALTREPPPPTVPSSNFPGREGERFRSGLNPSCTHHFHPHSNLTLPTVHSPALLFTTEPHHPLPPTLSQLSPVLPRGHQAMASKFPSFFSHKSPRLRLPKADLGFVMRLLTRPRTPQPFRFLLIRAYFVASVGPTVTLSKYLK